MSKYRGIINNTDCYELYLIADKNIKLPDAAYITCSEKAKNDTRALKEFTEAWNAAGYLLIARKYESIHEIHDFVNKRYGKKSYVHDLVNEAEVITIFNAE